MNRTSQGASGGVVFEALEPRLLLNGNIQVHIEAKFVEIRGDALGNWFSLEDGPAPGEFVITGQGGTTINGGAQFTVDAGDRNIRINTKAGDDTVDIKNINFLGGLFARTGLGDDRLDLTDALVDGMLKINMGRGESTLNIIRAVVGTRYDGVLAAPRATLFNGQRADVVVESSILYPKVDIRSLGGTVSVPDAGTLLVQDTEFKRSLEVRTGGKGDAISFASVDIGTTLHVSSGRGDDVLNFDALVVGGGTDVNTGPGDDEINLVDTSPTLDNDFGGRTVFRTGRGGDFLGFTRARARTHLVVFLGAGPNGLTMHEMTVDGKCKIRGGAGADQLEVTSSTFGGDLSVSGKQGPDDVTLDQNTVDGKCEVNGGAGADQLQATDSTFRSHLVVLCGVGTDGGTLHTVRVEGNCRVRGGRGGDWFTIESSVFDQLVNGLLGAGDDQLTVEANTTTGGGTIRGGHGTDTLEDKGGHGGTVLNYEGFENII